MINWKTTLAGFLGAIALNIQNALAVANGQAVNWQTVVLGAILASLGAVAKDAGVTGGTKAATPEAVGRV